MYPKCIYKCILYYIYLSGAGPQEPEQVCYNKTVYVREVHYDITYSQECATQYKEECETNYKTSCKQGYETVRYRYPLISSEYSGMFYLDINI